MKRIAIVAIGSWGDVGPLITLGSGLAGAGYEVVLVTHAAYAEDATRAGLDFAPLSGDPVAIPEDERGRQWLESGGNGLRFALHLVRIARPLQRAVLDEAYAACRSCAAVLHTPFASFATHVAERLELPSIVVGQQPVTRTGAWRAFLVPDGLPLGRAGNRLSYRLMEQAMWQPYRSGFQRWRRDAGMPDAGPFGPAARLYTGRVPVVYGFSSLVVTRPADWPAWHRAAGYWTAPARGSWDREDARVAAFLRDGPPPVFVGFGSMTSRNPQRVLARVVEALRVVGCRGLLAGAAAAGRRGRRSRRRRTCWSPRASRTPARCRGWRRPSTTAAPARWPPASWPACRRWWCRSSPTSSSGAAGWRRWGRGRSRCRWPGWTLPDWPAGCGTC